MLISLTCAPVKKSNKGVDLIASLCSIYDTSEDDLRKIMEKTNTLIADILKKKHCEASECKNENLENIDTGSFISFSSISGLANVPSLTDVRENLKLVNADGLIYFENLMDDSSLSSSLNILEKDYDNATRNKGELDERVFINEDDSLLGSGSLSGGAVSITGAKVCFNEEYF